MPIELRGIDLPISDMEEYVEAATGLVFSKPVKGKDVVHLRTPERDGIVDIYKNFLTSARNGKNIVRRWLKSSVLTTDAEAIANYDRFKHACNTAGLTSNRGFELAEKFLKTLSGDADMVEEEVIAARKLILGIG